MNAKAALDKQGMTPQRIDIILYNRRLWRELADGLAPKTSTSVVPLGVTQSRTSSSIETVGINRAVISQVLDVVDRAVATVEPEVIRVILRLKYDRVWAGRKKLWSHWRIGRSVHYSESQVDRYVAAGRKWVARCLGAQLSAMAMKDFWKAIERLGGQEKPWIGKKGRWATEGEHEMAATLGEERER